jgi:hypothetical protein
MKSIALTPALAQLAHTGAKTLTCRPGDTPAPYAVGDVCYIRETWQAVCDGGDGEPPALVRLRAVGQPGVVSGIDVVGQIPQLVEAGVRVAVAHSLVGRVQDGVQHRGCAV